MIPTVSRFGMSHATNSTPGLLKAKQEMSVTAQPVKARDDELRVEDAAGGERFRQGWPAAVILVIGPSTQEIGRVHILLMRSTNGPPIAEASPMPICPQFCC
jgi:hypothetical protein